MTSGSGLSRRASAGFTLIEMLVVIIIMAVMAGMVIPAHARFLAKERFDQAVEQTLSMLASARQQALNTGEDVQVTPDLQNGAWVVQPDTSSTTAQDTDTTPDQTDEPVAMSDEDAAEASAPDTKTVQLPEDVTVSRF